MADPKRAVAENVEGDFFVDSTCINCDACRQLAPETFLDAGATSCVQAQPGTPVQERKALRALLSCPTGSIGTRNKSKAAEVVGDFPLKVDKGVFYCGFNSAKSYGGNSFFVQHAAGNWLIDSPRFVSSLVKQFKTLGGLKYIFLTHQDDVADAHKYAREFGAKRIIHAFDAKAEPESEIIIGEEKPVHFAPDFEIIPVPGHTRGHMVLLYKQLYLFSGDHLFFDSDCQRLSATRTYCWYSWERQTESMASLANFEFEWVLPGHGRRIHLSKEKIHEQMTELVGRMRLPICQWNEHD
jgi:glyoxylase-like metal-dependent hydrolase (beta-lactamase superfamily II)/ferredoxin